MPSTQTAFVAPTFSGLSLKRKTLSIGTCPQSAQIKALNSTRSVIHASLPALVQAEADSCLEQHGLVITSSEWKPPTLTVFIDNTLSDGRGASAEDCATASQVIGEVLDKADFGGKSGYTLEVSTPGASDVLTQEHEFVAFKGFPVRVAMTEEFKGRNVLEGKLVGRSDVAVRVGMGGRVVNVPREIVAEVKLSQSADE